MPKMTKTQAKNMLRAIQTKATKLALTHVGLHSPLLTVQDVGKINAILLRANNKIKKM